MFCYACACGRESVHLCHCHQRIETRISSPEGSLFEEGWWKLNSAESEQHEFFISSTWNGTPDKILKGNQNNRKKKQVKCSNGTERNGIRYWWFQIHLQWLKSIKLKVLSLKTKLVPATAQVKKVSDVWGMSLRIQKCRKCQ